MDKQAVEQQLCQLPVSQYAWIDPRKIEFSDRVRYVAKTMMPHVTGRVGPDAGGRHGRVLPEPGAVISGRTGLYLAG